MRDMKKKILSCLGFLGILAVILAGLSHLFRPKNNREDFGMGEMKANGILTEAENSIDVVAVGDSECALAVSPMVLWQEEGITSYNCGTTGQYLYEAYSYLRQAFRRQEIQVVLLETNMIFRECEAEDWLFSKAEDWLPVLRYHDRWKSLRAEDLGPVAYTWTDDYKGWLLYRQAEPYCGGEYMIPTEDEKWVSDVNQACLAEIVSLCDREGASLILVSTPSPVNWNYESHNAVQTLADRWDIPYLDLNLTEEINIDWQTETKDGGDHMNCFGAAKVSSWLASYLAGEYDLPDHRDDGAYAGWDQALAVYQEEMEEIMAAQ